MNCFSSKKLMSVALISACLLSGSFVHASGSFSGGGSNALSEKEQQYYKGKEVMRKKIKCKSCVLADEKINRKNAADFITRVNGGEFSSVLNSEETGALLVYVARRYRVQN